MPEKDGSEDKKSTKSVLNKKQKQFMNQEEQLDLSSVAESFGGQIVGEPKILNEIPAILAVPAIGAGIFGTGAIGYDSYEKLKGRKGILPDLSGTVKGVYDKVRGVFKTANTEQQRKYQKRQRKILDRNTYNKTKDKFFKNNNKNNNKNKNFNKKDFGLGLGSGLGTSTAISTLTKGKKKGGGGFRLGGLPGTAHNVGRRTNPQ